MEDRDIETVLNGANQWETDGKPDHFIFLDLGVEAAPQLVISRGPLQVGSIVGTRHAKNPRPLQSSTCLVKFVLFKLEWAQKKLA